MARWSLRFAFASSLVGVLVVWAAPATAALVTVSGGFDRYVGPAGVCGQFTTFIAATNVTPATGCDPATGWKMIDVTFPQAYRVGFYGVQFGNTLNLNSIGFTPAAAQDVSAKGVEFSLGRLDFTNGTWFGIGAQSKFHLTLTTDSLDPNLDNKVLDDWLVLDITPTLPGNAPYMNADRFYFEKFGAIGTLSVYELFDSPLTGSNRNVGSVSVTGKIGSLIPTALTDPDGAAFVGQVAPQPVPEPATLTMVGLGLGAFVRRIRRHRAPVA